MYKIVYEKRIFKDLDKVPGADLSKILAVFKELLSNPIPRQSKKLSATNDLYRIRRGKYRVIYSIDHKEKEIRIVVVSQRKEVYKKI